MSACEHVLGDGQVREHRRFLVHGDEAQPVRSQWVGDPPRLAFDEDVARVWLDDAGEDLDQSRLAGAVLADERVHGGALDWETDARYRVDAPVGLRDAAQLDEGCPYPVGHRG
jgi:hypothetical protein